MQWRPADHTDLLCEAAVCPVAVHLGRTGLTSAGLRGLWYIHSSLWEKKVCVIAQILSDFVNSAKPCHLLRKKKKIPFS